MAADSIKRTKATTTLTTNGASGITQDGRLFYDPNTKTVRLYLYARSSNNIGTSDALAYVPEGYRPSGSWGLYGVIGIGAGAIAAYGGIVDANGKITQSLSGSARDVFLCGEWEL